MPRKLCTDKISKDAIAQYLAADLASMTQRAIQYENLLANKINFYLAIVTAAIGGLILSSGIPEVKPFLMPLACLVLLILSIMGSVTLLQGLDLSANAIFMFRRIGRDSTMVSYQEPSLFPYLPFSPGDDKPAYYVEYARLRSTESNLLIVNAVVTAALGTLLWLFFRIQVFQLSFSLPSTPYLVALGIGAIMFICIWLAEFSYAQKFMKLRDKTAKTQMYINFPSDEIWAKFERRNNRGISHMSTLNWIGKDAVINHHKEVN